MDCVKLMADAPINSGNNQFHKCITIIPNAETMIAANAMNFRPFHIQYFFMTIIYSFINSVYKARRRFRRNITA